jgi:hypothetical protein
MGSNIKNGPKFQLSSEYARYAPVSLLPSRQGAKNAIAAAKEAGVVAAEHGVTYATADLFKKYLLGTAVNVLKVINPSMVSSDPIASKPASLGYGEQQEARPSPFSLGGLIKSSFEGGFSPLPPALEKKPGQEG